MLPFVGLQPSSSLSLHPEAEYVRLLWYLQGWNDTNKTFQDVNRDFSRVFVREHEALNFVPCKTSQERMYSSDSLQSGVAIKTEILDFCPPCSDMRRLLRITQNV